MMKAFRTMSGSIYEVDQDIKMVRRVSGTKQATKLQSDGWKSYTSMSDIVLETPVLIIWKDKADGYAMPATLTSEVAEIADTTKGWLS